MTAEEPPRTARPKRCSAPGKTVTRDLFGNAVQCGSPDCLEPLFKFEDGKRTLNCEVAHIRASAPNGPRADQFMTCQEVNHFDNMILLCLFHAKHIDTHVDEHPVELLQHWKALQTETATAMGTTVAPTDAELEAATMQADGGAAALAQFVDVARSLHRLTTIAGQSRIRPAEFDASQTAELEAQNNRTQMWDSVTGELIRADRLSVQREDWYKDQIVAALNETLAAARTESDSLREAVAGVVAVVGSGAAPVAQWINRAVDDLLVCVARWPADVGPPATELERSVDGLRTITVGGTVEVPEPEPVAEPNHEPNPLQDLSDRCAELHDRAGPHTRVDGLAFDADLFAELLTTIPATAAFPTTMHVLSLGIAPQQLASLAAAVCRNANDSEFTTAIEAAEHVEPMSAAVEVLRQLVRINQDSNSERAQSAEAAYTRIGQQSLELLDDNDFWTTNGPNTVLVLCAAAAATSDAVVARAIGQGLDAGVDVSVVLEATAQYVDQHDSRTRQFNGIAARFSTGPNAETYAWLPTDSLVAAIRTRWPSLADSVNPAFSGDDSSTERLAGEFLASTA